MHKGKILLLVLILFHELCFAQYHSQCGQDQFVNEQFFKNKTDGVFVDIGAFDGVCISNSLFFEKTLNWTGICIEPLPQMFNELQNNRKCICIQGCVADFEGTGQFLMISGGGPAVLSGLLNKYDPRHINRINNEVSQSKGTQEIITVPCFLFNNLLEEHNINHVDFLSIDTEGGEFEILNSIDYTRFKIDVITVEDNYQDQRFIPFMQQKGYNFVKNLDQDLLFVHKDFQY